MGKGLQAGRRGGSDVPGRGVYGRPEGEAEGSVGDGDDEW